MNCYTYHQDQQQGPFPLAAFHEMLRTGSVPQDALVWHDGAAAWMPLADFLSSNPAPVLEARPVAVPRVVVSAAKQQEATSSEVGLLGKSIAAALGVGVVGGGGWAAFQVYVGIQLPYIFGVGLAWLCGLTVRKVSRDMSGTLFCGTAVGASLLGWLIGVFGVAAANVEPRIGIWTLICFVFALLTAWKTAAE